MDNIVMSPIGFVKNNVSERKDISWGEDTSIIKLDDVYSKGLKGLEFFFSRNNTVLS